MPHMVGTGAWLKMQPFHWLWAEATLPMAVGSMVTAAPKSSFVSLENVFWAPRSAPFSVFRTNALALKLCWTEGWLSAGFSFYQPQSPPPTEVHPVGLGAPSGDLN